MIVELDAIVGATVVTFAVGREGVILTPWVTLTAAATVLGTAVCVVAVPRVELRVAAATLGAEDSVHELISPVEIEGGIIVAPTFGTVDSVSAVANACAVAAAAAFGLAADIPSPKVAASADATTLGIAAGVIILVVESVAVIIAAATLGVNDSAHDAPADVEIEGSIISAATFGNVGVSAEPIEGISVITAALGPTTEMASPTEDASAETATFEGVPSVIVSVSLTVGTKTEAPTLGGTPKITVPVSPIVGASVETATFWVLACVIDAPTIIATIAAATFGEVDSLIAEANVGATVVAEVLGVVGRPI